MRADRLARIDFIARYAGRRRPQWIAERLGISPGAVIRLMWREGLSPTQRDDLLTTGHAADILGYSQQWINGLCRRGILHGWRNPGGRWWLIPREEIQRFLVDIGKRSSDPRLTDVLAWPRVLVARRRPKSRGARSR